MDAQKHFTDFLNAKGIRRSTRRNEVLDVFLQCEHHITANQLVELVHKKKPRIGIATVYRTLKLITEAGIARAVEFGDGTMRYEHDYGHEHHDHIVCVQCGMFREISNKYCKEGCIMRMATLEDVFLKLTGRELRE